MLNHQYDSIITIENLLITWERFLRGKRKKKDVIKFQTELATNISDLYNDLKNKTYVHGSYSAFNISDPKHRIIHKASVRDRVTHHLIYKELYWYFHFRFIYDSYSCRRKKGTHRALNRFQSFARRVSKNNTRTCFVLKCDIKRFFASIDQTVLLKILERHISNPNILWLINQVVSSFQLTFLGVGLPLGNLTSQLFANVYLHELDMYLKQELRVKYYIRYADDFAILSDDRKYLENLLPKIETFLREKLLLKLHEDKVYIKTYGSGVDFLGWVHFPHHRQIRTTTKKKIIRKMKSWPKREAVSSYRGLLEHGNTYRLRKQLGAAGNY